MVFTKRGIGKLYLFIIITLGIYMIYWLIKTKIEINENYNANIPTCWLLIIPIGNIYWLFRFTEVFEKQVRKKDDVAVYFLLFLIVGIIMPYVVQSELNKLSDNPNLINALPQQYSSGRICPNCGRPIPMDSQVCPYCGKDFRQ
jgi:predicted nucleic acid-binding Zn ribbon protein